MVLRLSSQKNFAPPLTHWISDSRQVWMRGGESPPSAWEVTEVFGKVNSVAMLQWYGYPCVLGITIPKTLVIWASPSHITLAIWVRVRVTGDTHIPRLLRMGTTKLQGCWCGKREKNESSSLLVFSLSSPSVFTGYDITFLWQGLTLVSCSW